MKAMILIMNYDKGGVMMKGNTIMIIMMMMMMVMVMRKMTKMRMMIKMRIMMIMITWVKNHKVKMLGWRT